MYHSQITPACYMHKEKVPDSSLPLLSWESLGMRLSHLMTVLSLIYTQHGLGMRLSQFLASYPAQPGNEANHPSQLSVPCLLLLQFLQHKEEKRPQAIEKWWERGSRNESSPHHYQAYNLG